MTYTMRVIFWDVKRETRKRVDNVHQIQSSTDIVNGRMTKRWVLCTGDDVEYLPQRHYQIERVELMPEI